MPESYPRRRRFIAAMTSATLIALGVPAYGGAPEAFNGPDHPSRLTLPLIPAQRQRVVCRGDNSPRFGSRGRGTIC